MADGLVAAVRNLAAAAMVCNFAVKGDFVVAVGKPVEAEYNLVAVGRNLFAAVCNPVVEADNFDAVKRNFVAEAYILVA